MKTNPAPPRGQRLPAGLRLRRALLLLIAAIACYTSWAAWSITAYSRIDERGPADAAVVLGAAVHGEAPSPVLRERIAHAVRLYEAGAVRKLIFTGGRGESGTPAESEVSRAYALAQGVPAGDILIETESRITEQNLAYALQTAHANGLGSFIIVSDPLHMKRAMTMAGQLGMQAWSSPTGTSVYRSWRTRIPFLGREIFYYTGYLVSLPFR